MHDSSQISAAVSKLQEGIFTKSLGTLGGGNHFIEYGEDTESGDGWLTIHCGSRNLESKLLITGEILRRIPNVRNTSAIFGAMHCAAISQILIIAQAYALYNHQIIRDRIFAILKNCVRLSVLNLSLPYIIIFQ